MGHYDEEALAAALRTPARYIGLVASRRRAQALLNFLQQSGWSEADLGRIRAPAGLDLGAVTQEEIALAVMAEIMQERRRAMAERMVSLESTSPRARDPVCGMEVEVATARYHVEWGGNGSISVAPIAGRRSSRILPATRQRLLSQNGGSKRTAVARLLLPVVPAQGA